MGERLNGIQEVMGSTPTVSMGIWLTGQILFVFITCNPDKGAL